MISQDFWKGKRVFLTGHTGFKGSWLSLWLTSLGAEVKGYALNPPTSPSLFNEAKIESIVTSEIGDIRNQDKLHKSMTTFNPDILLHMAAQPLVRYSYDNPVETYEVNVIGTAKVLEVARNCSNLKAIVNITTDKCYENDSRKEGYIETDSMGGYDQKPSCVNAIKLSSLARPCNGACSQVQSSPKILFKPLGKSKKKPPLIKAPSPLGFSTNFLIWSSCISNAPNLPGG
jgi:CDP-glucose 4,6-dehydratase